MTASLPPPFDRQPWHDCTLPAVAQAVPTMLTEEEGKLLFWLTRDYANGSGAVCDLGCFAGGSTARLAAGIAAAGRASQIFAYDHFQIEEPQKQRYLYPAGIQEFAGRDMLHAANQFLRPWQNIITLKRGDILKNGWQGDPIEVLFIDAAKTPRMTDEIANAFFPSLIPGHSVIVQQDYLHWRQPWVPAQMELLADCLTPVAWCRKGTVAFLVTAPVTAARVARDLVADLDDDQMTRLIRRAMDRFGGRPQHVAMARAILGLQDNPGIRTPQRIDGTAINRQRIDDLLAERT